MFEEFEYDPSDPFFGIPFDVVEIIVGDSEFSDYPDLDSE